MNLVIHSLKRTLFTGEVRSLNCKTESGEITVLDHHRPLITILTTGTLTILDDASQEHFFPISKGFLEVQDGKNARLIVEE